MFILNDRITFYKLTHYWTSSACIILFILKGPLYVCIITPEIFIQFHFFLWESLSKISPPKSHPYIMPRMTRTLSPYYLYSHQFSAESLQKSASLQSSTSLPILSKLNTALFNFQMKLRVLIDDPWWVGDLSSLCRRATREIFGHPYQFRIL